MATRGPAVGLYFRTEQTLFYFWPTARLLPTLYPVLSCAVLCCILYVATTSPIVQASEILIPIGKPSLLALNSEKSKRPGEPSHVDSSCSSTRLGQDLLTWSGLPDLVGGVKTQWREDCLVVPCFPPNPARHHRQGSTTPKHFEFTRNIFQSRCTHACTGALNTKVNQCYDEVGFRCGRFIWRPN